MRKANRLHNKFPWEHFVDEKNKVVFVHVPGGYPTTLATPKVVSRFFPGYTPKLCTQTYLQTLIENEQKESS